LILLGERVAAFCSVPRFWPEEWKRTERRKRRKGEERGEEAKDVGKDSKPNNPRFPQRKNTAAILMDESP
jgi:hypothetical protein